MKEEVANLLMLVSPDFDDTSSLLEVQKYATKTTTVNDKDTEGEMVLNFNEEPNKC